MDIATRERFDAVADDYDRSRPCYPSELIDRLQPPGQTLEIGCGSGQLTVDLLSRGHHVMAVDIGARLLVHAARRCPEGNFVLGAFEEIDLEPHRFDLVVSATAFHWVDPIVGYPKASALLRRAGRLALLAHRIVAGPCPDQFDAAVRRCAPSFPVGVLHSARTLEATVGATSADNVSAVLAAIEGRANLRTDAAKCFDSAEVNSVEWDQSLTSSELLDAVAATSVWPVLPRHEIAKLTDGLRAMVDDLGGRYIRRRLTFLVVANRKADV